jgi:hypothetical protein
MNRRDKHNIAWEIVPPNRHVINMENIDNTSNEGEVENVQTESLPVEEKATEETVATETKPTGEVEETPAETVGESKRGYSQRVRELNQRAKQAEAERDSLKAELEKLTGSYEPGGIPPINTQVNPGDEISPERYSQDVARAADTIVSLRLKQQQALAKVNSEAESVLKAYPQLDPESDQYDEDLSRSVTAAVSAHVKADPFNASVKKFTDMLMKPYQRSVTREVGKAQETIAKQVSQAALKPNGIKGDTRKPEDKSIEELEKELGIVY